MSRKENDELISFPCDFPIKIIGEITKEAELFEQEILSIAHKHHPELAEDRVSKRLSNGGNYLAITITVEAQSQEALDALYADLIKHPNAKMVL